jgi:uncharacterized repeat protein (TIGR01451 family)
MKRGTWILAACGVVATALTIAIAQDNGSLEGRLEPYRKSQPARLGVSGRQLSLDPAETAAKSPPAKREVAEAAPGFPAAAGGESAAAPAPPTERGKTDRHPLAESHPLIHADHNQAAGVRKPRQIKQVGATADGDDPLILDLSPSEKAFDASPKQPEKKPEIVVTPKAVQPAKPPLRRASFSKTTTALSTAKLPSAGQAPNVTVQWSKKGDLNVGQECQCSLVVTNFGMADARDVIVEASLPATVRVTKAEPLPNETKETAIWKFASLKAGEVKTIQLTLIPSRRGDLNATASVRFTGLAAGRFSVKEPMLKVELSGPSTALVGDSASQFITVSNPGTGVAKNVAVEASIPAGLEHPRGERLVMEIGSLNPGESRKVRLSLTAIAGGEQKIRVKATAVAALAQAQERVVKVTAPSLKVVLNGPGLRYVGRNAVYTLKVTNDGTVATNNVRVVHKLPDGFKFLKADKGGSYDAGKRTIAWFVGRVEPGSAVEVKSVLTTTKLGDFTHVAGVLSEQGVKADTTCKTKVDGTASLIVEIVDLDDPVEVGAETAYEVRIRNDGSKAAGNVKIACELAKGVELLGAKGPTQSATKDGRITFEPLPSLEPGKSAVYRIQVKGTLAGDLRFRAHVSSDANSKTLTYDELTKFYGEK